LVAAAIAAYAFDYGGRGAAAASCGENACAHAHHNQCGGDYCSVILDSCPEFSRWYAHKCTLGFLYDHVVFFELENAPAPQIGVAAPDPLAYPGLLIGVDVVAVAGLHEGLIKLPPEELVLHVDFLEFGDPQFRIFEILEVFVEAVLDYLGLCGPEGDAEVAHYLLWYARVFDGIEEFVVLVVELFQIKEEFPVFDHLLAQFCRRAADLEVPGGFVNDRDDVVLDLSELVDRKAGSAELFRFPAHPDIFYKHSCGYGHACQ